MNLPPNLLIWILLFASTLRALQLNGTVIVAVRSQSGPVTQVEVRIGDQVTLTDDRGEAKLEAPPGEVTVSLQRYGFASKTVRTQVSAGAQTVLRSSSRPKRFSRRKSSSRRLGTMCSLKTNL